MKSYAHRLIATLTILLGLGAHCFAQTVVVGPTGDPHYVNDNPPTISIEDAGKGRAWITAKLLKQVSAIHWKMSGRSVIGTPPEGWVNYGQLQSAGYTSSGSFGQLVTAVKKALVIRPTELVSVSSPNFGEVIDYSITVDLISEGGNILFNGYIWKEIPVQRLESDTGNQFSEDIWLYLTDKVYVYAAPGSVTAAKWYGADGYTSTDLSVQWNGFILPTDDLNAGRVIYAYKDQATGAPLGAGGIDLSHGQRLTGKDLLQLVSGIQSPDVEQLDPHYPVVDMRNYTAVRDGNGRLYGRVPLFSLSRDRSEITPVYYVVDFRLPVWGETTLLVPSGVYLEWLPKAGYTNPPDRIPLEYTEKGGGGWVIPSIYGEWNLYIEFDGLSDTSLAYPDGKG